jgi:glutaredoxin
MDYLLFTYPNCDRCAAFKDFLKNIPLQGQELNLVQKESKLRVREFLDRIKRDESGGMILPIFVLRHDDQVLGIFNDPGELENCLKSRD